MSVASNVVSVKFQVDVSGHFDIHIYSTATILLVVLCVPIHSLCAVFSPHFCPAAEHFEAERCNRFPNCLHASVCVCLIRLAARASESELFVASSEVVKCSARPVPSISLAAYFLVKCWQFPSLWRPSRGARPLRILAQILSTQRFTLSPCDVKMC